VNLTEWYMKALVQIGLDALLSIYTVVYGCDWSSIENIINPLLGGTWWQVLDVSPHASAEEARGISATGKKHGILM